MLRIRSASRFRLRTLMLLVLLAGVASGAERAWCRRRAYLDRAARHAAAEARLTAEARALAAQLARYRAVLSDRPGCGNPRLYAAALERGMAARAAGAAGHGRWKQRYLQAASRPWLRVPPDPPPPE